MAILGSHPMTFLRLISMYDDLMNGHTRFLRKYLWKLKIPLKIKIFMWLLNKNSRSQKIIFLRGSGRDVLNAPFGAAKSRQIIYSFLALLLDLYGELFFALIIFLHHLICLEIY